MNRLRHQALEQRGAALLIFIVFFLVASIVFTFGIARGAYHDLVAYRTLEAGKRSVYAAEAGIEDAIYRHRGAVGYSDSETFTIMDTTVTMTRTLNVDQFEITAAGEAAGAYRTTTIKLTVGDGVSFNFGLQSGNGGIEMSNNSSVSGNVFSNLGVRGQGSALIKGDIITAGPGGFVQSVTATGSVWSNTITSSSIGKDAYYSSISGSTVLGNQYPNSPDQPSVPMPVSDEKIEEWKAGIQATGTIIASTSPECAGGTYIMENDITLNNIKIECNVNFRKKASGTTITIAGPVWITGNLAITQGPNIVASSSLGNKSVQIIVDNPTDRLTSSQISVNQSTTFTSGSPKSFIMLVSMNNSAELGGTEIAINLAQSANGKVLVYAPHGLISMGNSITLKEVTGYKINIGNSANVVYESGLLNLLFTSGPGGGYTTSDWRETE